VTLSCVTVSISGCIETLLLKTVVSSHLAIVPMGSELRRYGRWQGSPHWDAHADAG
jgi:hypothetical protein